MVHNDTLFVRNCDVMWRDMFAVKWINEVFPLELYMQISIILLLINFGFAVFFPTIGSASGSRDFTRFGPGGSTLSRFPCKTPIGKVGTSQYTFVTRKLA